MASQNLVINGVQYNAVPEIDIPKQGGGTAKFYDVSDATLNNNNQLLNGVKGVGANGTLYTGNIASKSAQTYKPSSTDQTINSGQYLSGAQTFSAVTTTNLQAQYIANGVTVKVGCSADDDCVASVTGTLSSPVISQDSTTKILSIS